VAVDDDLRATPAWTGSVGISRIPASAGALIWDRSGRLLILKPTYKGGCTIPGGIFEANG
jgi:hypothetical protein